MPSFRSFLKSFERRFIRPTGRRIRRRLRRLTGDSERVAKLESRIAALETLVREMTGLAYLCLEDHRHTTSRTADGNSSDRSSREAA